MRVTIVARGSTTQLPTVLPSPCPIPLNPLLVCAEGSLSGAIGQIDRHLNTRSIASLAFYVKSNKSKQSCDKAELSKALKINKENVEVEEGEAEAEEESAHSLEISIN